jgi:hypothetical protein
MPSPTGARARTETPLRAVVQLWDDCVETPEASGVFDPLVSRRRRHLHDRAVSNGGTMANSQMRLSYRS